MPPNFFRPRPYSLRITLAAAAIAASSLAGAEAGVKLPSFASIMNPPQAGLKFETAAGQCRFEKSPDGMWWQSDHENDSRYKNNRCGEVGVSMKFAPAPAIGWSARYVTLGDAETNALAVSCPGDDCAGVDHHSAALLRPECAQAFAANCLYHWRTVNTIKGFNFALNGEILRHGPFAAELEAGAFVYYLKSYAEVHSPGCNDGACPWRVEIQQYSGWLVSPMVGATLRAGPFFVASRYYFRTSQHSPVTAGIAGGAQTWLIGIQTSF